MDCDGSRQADCSILVDQRQRTRGHSIWSVVSPAQLQYLRKTRNADNAVVQCSRQDRWCFQEDECRSTYTLVYKYTRLVLDVLRHPKPIEAQRAASCVVIPLRPIQNAIVSFRHVFSTDDKIRELHDDNLLRLPSVMICATE